MDSTPNTASQASAEVGDASHPGEAPAACEAEEAVHQVASIDGYGDLDHNDQGAVSADPPEAPSDPVIVTSTDGPADERADHRADEEGEQA